MPFDWGDVPAWVAAIGTVGTLIAALGQIRMDKMVRRLRETRQHAEQVSVWIGTKRHPDTEITIQNLSSAPIYNVVVTLVIQFGAGPKTGEEVANLGSKSSSDMRCAFLVIPPGAYVTELPTTWAGMNRRPGAEIAFTDSRGGHWVRRFNGKLEALAEDAISTMKISLPFGEGTLRHINDSFLS